MVQTWPSLLSMEIVKDHVPVKGLMPNSSAMPLMAPPLGSVTAGGVIWNDC